MSRTFKDRPYRIKVQKDGCVREAIHRHYRFGVDVYGYRPVLDEKGKVIYDEEPIMQYVQWAKIPRTLTAKFPTPISKFSNFYYIKDDSWLDYEQTTINPLWVEQQRLLASGAGMTKMCVGFRKVVRREEVILYTVKDYCTVDEEWDGQWWGEQPCHKDLPAGYAQPRWASKWAKSSKLAREGGRRVRNLRSSKRLADAYNSGLDLDEFEHDMNEITEVDARSRWW